MSDTSTTDQTTGPEAPTETPSVPEQAANPAPAVQTNDTVPTWPVIPPVAPHGYQQATGEFIE